MPTHATSKRWLLRLGFVLALALTLFFGVRTTLSALYWNDPLHSDQVIEGWMPVGYIGRSWDVPRDVIAESIGYDPLLPRRRSLEQIAAQRGVPVATLIAAIMAAIQTHRDRPHD